MIKGEKKKIHVNIPKKTFEVMELYIGCDPNKTYSEFVAQAVEEKLNKDIRKIAWVDPCLKSRRVVNQ
jgi:Arc/MetJ-type ribon-helix-helix transcriptional regulator